MSSMDSSTVRPPLRTAILRNSPSPLAASVAHPRLHERAHARGKLEDVERLGHVLLHALLEREDLREVLRLGGEHDDRDVRRRRVVADLHQRHPAVHLRHHDVEHDDVDRGRAVRTSRASAPSPALETFMPSASSPMRIIVDDRRIVVDDEHVDSWVHLGVSSFLGRRCRMTAGLGRGFRATGLYRIRPTNGFIAVRGRAQAAYRQNLPDRRIHRRARRASGS